MQTSSNTSLARPLATERFRSQARPEDLDAVVALTRSTGVFSESEVAIARELVEENLQQGAAESGYYLLFADGEAEDGTPRIDGYACFGPIPGTDNRFELYWIAVHPEAKRSGVGKLLARATEDAVRAEGGTHIFCATSTKAEYWPARAFYEAQGYAQMADIPDYHADGDGMAIYGKKL
jgi:ribosomal protein S18 acetylase RimI-like enzyme